MKTHQKVYYVHFYLGVRGIVGLFSHHVSPSVRSLCTVSLRVVGRKAGGGWDEDCLTLLSLEAVNSFQCVSIPHTLCLRNY